MELDMLVIYRYNEYQDDIEGKERKVKEEKIEGIEYKKDYHVKEATYE